MNNWDWMEPYGVLIAGLLAVLLLIVLKKKLGERKKAPEPLELPSDIEIGNAQTKGRRQEQDDYFASAATKLGTMAVIADGISGLANGRMSSTLAVTVFTQEFMKVGSIRDIEEYFHRAAAVSNRSIIEQLGGAHGGTTLVAAVVSQGLLHWGAVGDSMILLFRDGEFMAVNSKHTLETVLEQQYLAGQISREEARENPKRNQLINYLGYEGFKSMEIGEPIQLRKDDIVLLCSDGVYDALTEVELEQILMRRQPPQDTAEAIIDYIEGKSYKHQDNATVMILEKGW
ncbi:serine/threonine protein phosphatase [Paenibacillus sp. CAA11]|uniref:PP2C family protein-serine/threonine phosphatase n=1 Tax=Paenibacillus sp. CAA11 TaxID=1532905 RepID=UPI000D361B25|nr:PP2C family serine/threonine-protein phosphatase [Paenibacillus sp. CAA11]AWB43676.1 serine/threonine protein phosphatase [Paenibacillus sp. CAA11]